MTTDLAAKYRLQRALSWTAAARTFAGQNPDNGEKLAVKVMSLAGDPQREALTRRFTGTASVLHSLGHPTLPHVVDYGVNEAGEAYLACEWFPGAPLSDLDLDPGDVLSVVMQVVEALESLSLHGLVHLGIAPENVLVMPDRRAQLTGWGSSLLNVDWQSGQGAVLGVSNDYTAPELKAAGGIGEALWRADLYSIAKMAADLLGAEVTTEFATVQVRFPGELSRQISRPESLRAALEACLDPNPDLRPDSYSAFAKALQHAMPREQRQDVTATQPMPRLREPGAVASSGQASGNSASGAASGLPPIPPLPGVSEKAPDTASLAGSPDPNRAPLETPLDSALEAEATPEPTPEPNGRTEEDEAIPSETGVHAIRQETGSLVLPKSSSEVTESPAPLFEADELGKMIDDLASEELIDDATAARARTSTSANPAAEPGSPGSGAVATVAPGEAEATVDAAESETVRESTTAEIAVPVVAIPPQDESASEAVSDPDSRDSPDQYPSAEEADKQPNNPVSQPSEVEVATRWVSPVALNELVKEAELQHLSESDPAAVAEEFGGQLPSGLDKTVLSRQVQKRQTSKVEKTAEVAAPVEFSEAARASGTSSNARKTPPADKSEHAHQAGHAGAEVSPKKVVAIELGSAQAAGTLDAGKTQAVAERARDDGDGDNARVNGTTAPASGPALGVPTSYFRRDGENAEPEGPVQAPPPIAQPGGDAEGSSRHRLFFGLAAAALLLVLVLAGSMVAGLFSRSPEPVDEPVLPRVADVVEESEKVEPTLQQLPEELERLVILVAEGNWQEAIPLSRMLQARADEGDLSPADGEVFLNAQQALDLGYGADLRARLAPAVETLNVNEMRDALRGGAVAMSALRLQPGGAELAGRARRVLRSVDAFRSALDRGEGVEPLDRALDLDKAYPALANRFDAVKRATSRVELTAMELVDEGRLGDAASLVSSVDSKIELSPKLKALNDSISTQLQARAETAQVLETAEAFGQEGTPHRGLELLAAGGFTERTRARAAEVRRRLQAQLADLDRDPPQVDLSGEGIDLKRGEPLMIEVIVKDDYEVTDVSFEVIADGRESQSMPVRAEPGGHYRVQIPSSLHQGKPVRFWVTAIDRSGHRGSLGSRSEPIEVRRKRWFQVFKRRGNSEG